MSEMSSRYQQHCNTFTTYSIPTMPPPQITTLLSALRAPIFNTLAVTSNIRTGNKYLRRRLRGDAILNYHPKPRTPDVKALNANTPENQYYGWDGSERCDAATAASPHLPFPAVTPGFVEVQRYARPSAGQGRISVPGPFAGRWLEDSKEYDRFEHVAHMRKLGKGAPKKGMCRGGGTLHCLLIAIC